MAQNETPITIIGNLVSEPELRYTPSGVPVTNFRIASTPRKYNQQEKRWEDQDALFLTCNVWRQAAEHAANTLTKGTRAIVTGTLTQRQYTTRDGQQRSTYEVTVTDLGPSLLFTSATLDQTPGTPTGVSSTTNDLY